jgi:hypothetical protein
MTELEYVFIIFIAFIALALSHSLGATKMKREMMRYQHGQLDLVQNLCGSILRRRGGEKWEKFESLMKDTLNLTEESCHHNCDLNRNHYFQLQTFIEQQLHLIYLLSEEEIDPRAFDRLYFDDRVLKIKPNG